MDSAGVRLVVESSGRFTRRADAARHLRGGVTHAVISAPSPDPDFTVMLPFNGDRLDLGAQRVLSNASCTAHAWARTPATPSPSEKTELIARIKRLLVERVKAILRRAGAKDAAAPARTEDAKALERGLLRMDPERHTCTWKGEPVTLTVTEFLILQALAQRPGVVKSRNALMDAAYDDQVYVDDRTIDSHIKRLRKKFKMVDTDFDMIETLYGVGYRFREAA